MGTGVDDADGDGEALGVVVGEDVAVAVGAMVGNSVAGGVGVEERLGLLENVPLYAK